MTQSLFHYNFFCKSSLIILFIIIHIINYHLSYDHLSRVSFMPSHNILTLLTLLYYWLRQELKELLSLTEHISTSSCSDPIHNPIHCKAPATVDFWLRRIRT